ncbi:anhydro-N-acetylmuramic acid kinase [Hymenobacter sp. 15J16-1T3B]|uniref:anhydro-N-acetylmuramic acid kinase n=1 Tax=Hymenobacter sp. 15J16-1T3B TaxID=2886941 RepID=UPI001D121CC7|nr:anhydro-N-acetylmuramic acid kinase [Hymenobacter sp. 15J16-1T3B]MCC3157712.1 anhydro-N-acetylmuramic acid kinase [Hymenobacter sp. 15J16-1T3B]
MNPHLARLCRVAAQPSRRILGLMSGTSLDGLDLALCRFEGHGPATRLTLEQFVTLPYAEDVRHRIRRVFAQDMVSLEELTLLNAWIGTLHGQLVLDALRSWGVEPAAVDALASHGQTVYHAPRHQHQRPEYPLDATLQIGDGDHLAVRTGIITLSDFRQKHVAAGGEGAPLAAYGDVLLFSSPAEDRLLLNLGGIANFTYLPASGDTTQVFSTDVGPGNTLLDAFVRELYPGHGFDPDGQFAAAGTVNTPLLTALLDHPFFAAPLPKTTGPELFGPAYVRAAQERSATTALSPADLLASLTAFSAAGIQKAVEQALGSAPQAAVYVSGGGMHNPTLLASIRRALPHCRFADTQTLGVAPDAKEAVLFAVLANEALAGSALSIGQGRQRVPAVTMGKISLPA